MEKFRKALKHLFAPAIVLLLVAVMGVFSPVVSVVAALRLQTAALVSTNDYIISNLPARTAKVGDEITVPTIDSGVVKLCHAGKETTVSGTYTYGEVGQYEWRFYTAASNGILFDTYTVSVTDTAYTMTMPSNVVTVAPKGLNKLELPLPASYTVGSETMDVDSIEWDGENHYAVVTLVDDDDKKTKYHLSAVVSLENDTFAANKITINAENVVIDLSSHKESTGSLKVTYLLKSASDKLLVALPLTDIEIKNVTASDVTFANIPTAPSVSNLSYYSSVALTAPSADSAKVDDSTSFSVEAQTRIVQIQVYLYATEPSSWTKKSVDVHTLTVDENGVVKEGDKVSDLVEIDGLNVKVKALGWYRFQFQTSTLFGYQMDDDFDNYDAIEQDSDKTYVRYWSDSIRIYRDSVEPNFAWVADYTLNKDEEGNVTGYTAGEGVDYDEDFSDYLNDYDAYLPMTEKPDATASKKITVNYTQGLTLPAIFPHDNATPFAKMTVTAFSIDQIQDADGNTVTDNYVWSGTTSTNNTFKYSMNKHVQIKFEPNGIGSGVQSENNEVVLKAQPGLYRVRVVVEEKQPKFLGSDEYYSGGYAQTKTKYLYFYVEDDTTFEVADSTTNSPVIDENNVFQISDVYLWEGHTFDFPAPSYTDDHTPTDNIQVDYYLVQNDGTTNNVIAQLDYASGASRITVDLDNLHDEDGKEVKFETIDFSTGTFYIYAVARNFNAMQANLKYDYIKTDDTEANLDGTHFDTKLFAHTTLGTKSEVAQYGYAWKRAQFAFHVINNTNAIVAANTGVTLSSSNVYTATKAIKIDKIAVDWGTQVDGQVSAAVYLVNSDNVLVPVDIVNDNDASAEVVSSVAFNLNKYEIKDLYFTPDVSGDYILVMTAKDHASSTIYTKITNIEIDSSGDIGVRPRSTSLSTAAATSSTIDKTISLGDTLTLPDYDLLDSKNKPLYASRNRNLYAYDSDGELTSNIEGYYTITVMGVTDPNCITGNKFVPGNTGKYKFQYNFYDNSGNSLRKPVNYIVQVSESSSTSSSILMGEDYDATGVDGVLWVDDLNDDTDANGNTTYEVNNVTYHVGAQGTGTASKPAYAITLNQFVMANYGASNDFVVDTASLYNYLEPIYGATTATNDTNITGYMYPAIAIPNPNVVTGTSSSDEVEIIVQKSGSSNYLVSSKKENAGGSSNKASVIEKFGDYYVFRPDGTFSTECKDSKHNADNYLLTANSRSGASGVYTITYKTSTTSVSYNVTFGNLQNGELDWNENFLTYNNGKKDVEITTSSDDIIIDKDDDGHRYVTIDMTKVFFTGNNDMSDLIAQGPNGDGTTTGYNSANSDAATEYYWSKVTVTVSYENGSFIDYDDWSEAEDETAAIKNHSEYYYKFDLTQGSGTYKVTIRMTNSYTSTPVTASIEFTLDAESTNKNVNLNTVWGTILIVLSVGLLAGVIFYFVKTARATRFVDTPRAIKGKDKNKAAKEVAAPKEAPKDAPKDVAKDAPKDAEAPKNDAK